MPDEPAIPTILAASAGDGHVDGGARIRPLDDLSRENNDCTHDIAPERIHEVQNLLHPRAI